MKMLINDSIIRSLSVDFSSEKKERYQIQLNEQNLLVALKIENDFDDRSKGEVCGQQNDTDLIQKDQSIKPKT